MNSKSLYFFGGVSATKQGHGGETIKNGILLDYLRRSGFSVKVLDTVHGKKNKLRFIFNVVWSLVSLNKRKIILSASTVSAVKYLKLASWFNVHHKEILYFVIGGTLNTRVKNKEVDYRVLKEASKIYVEAHEMVKDLTECNISNVERLPNFKTIPIISTERVLKGTGSLKLVYVSRIMEEKGVLVLLDAFKALLSKYDKLTLDFFGPVEKKFETTFFDILSSNERVQYKGFLDFANDINAYKQLSKYDIKILPTFHYGEGFPGVFIDCFIAGIPVITTNWNYNAEVIEHNENGLLVNNADSNDVCDAVSNLITNIDLLETLKVGAFESAKQYDVSLLLDPIFKYIYR